MNVVYTALDPSTTPGLSVCTKHWKPNGEVFALLALDINMDALPIFVSAIRIPMLERPGSCFPRFYDSIYGSNFSRIDAGTQISP